MYPALQTARLRLQPVQFADAAQVQQLFPQWEIVQHLNAAVPWPFPPDGVEKYFHNVLLPSIERGDCWCWTLRLKASPLQIIGAIDLVKGEGLNRGFWIAPPFQRRGLMTEAVAAANDFWFDTLGFPVLRAPKAVANTGSRRISEKTGMRLIATEDHDFVCGRLPAEIWEITAAEWRAHKRTMSLQVP